MFSSGLDTQCPAPVFRETLGSFLVTPVAFFYGTILPGIEAAPLAEDSYKLGMWQLP